MKNETFYQSSALKEQKQHGDILFPMKYYRTELDFHYSAVAMHWHPEMEITKILDGTALYSINLQNYEAHPGDFVCVQPNLLHSATVPFHHTMSSDTFVFHLNLLGNSSADICDFRYLSPIMKEEFTLPCIIRMEDSYYPQIDEIFQRISTLYTSQSFGYELEIKAHLFHLLCILLNHTETAFSAQLSTQNERLKNVFEYIHTHYSQNISVEQAARIFCVTPSYFMHYFKDKTGITFNQYLNQFRLNKAASRLKKGADISETAYSCGFNNLPYFYKRFQEYYQMTPRQFQKTIEKK